MIRLPGKGTEKEEGFDRKKKICISHRYITDPVSPVALFNVHIPRAMITK